MDVYFDNAATTKISDTALRAMLPIRRESGATSSPHHRHRGREKLEEARRSVAANIGAEPSEIYFTSGGGEADNQALRSARAQRRASQ